MELQVHNLLMTIRIRTSAMLVPSLDRVAPKYLVTSSCIYWCVYHCARPPEGVATRRQRCYLYAELSIHH